MDAYEPRGVDDEKDGGEGDEGDDVEMAEDMEDDTEMGEGGDDTGVDFGGALAFRPRGD